MTTKKVEHEQVETREDTGTVERRVVACNAQFITVDAMKLSKGLKTTFEGVATVFDSIGVPVQLGLTMDVEGEDSTNASVESSKVAADAADAVSAVGDEPAGSVEPAEPTAPVVAVEKVAVKKKAKVESKPETAPVEGTQEEKAVNDPAPAEKVAPAAEVEAEPEVKEAPVKKAAEATSSITIDDITQVIVHKIKQNRKNNEKIGAILKTYEVARVGDLHPSKYEAFLTDLAAI